MKSPKVSVIVPVFNVSGYLVACLKSIVDQCFNDFELILIDDGSTDNSGAICDTFAKGDSRIRVIHTENRGVSAARNQGLNCARGDWVAFVDSDDLVGERYLQELYASALMCGEQYQAIVMGGASKVLRGTNVANKILRWGNQVVHKRDIPLLYLEKKLYEYASPFAKLFNRKCIEENGIVFDSEIRYGEDLIFLQKYLCVCSVVVLTDSSNYVYYVSPGAGLSKSYSVFESEMKFFRAFVSLSDQLLSGVQKDLSLYRQEEMLFFRALSCLYRPGIMRQREGRLLAIDNAVRCWSGVAFLGGASGWLLRNGHYALFDAILRILYGARYSLLSAPWRLYCYLRMYISG